MHDKIFLYDLILLTMLYGCCFFSLANYKLQPVKRKLKEHYKSIGWVMFFALIMFFSFDASAATPENCTTGSNFEQHTDKISKLLIDVISKINAALLAISENLYKGIIESDSYKGALGALLVICVAFFGVSFTFGFVPANASTSIMWLIKFGFVILIATPAGWGFFNDTIVKFFSEGTNCLINQMSAIGSGAELEGLCAGLDANTAVTKPLDSLTKIVELALSPRMLVMVVGAAGGSPFGVAIFLALAWAIVQLFMMLMKVGQIYALSLVVRTILYGLAPIFVGFLLFGRTKDLFIGWVNQLVNFSLQPILMFGFIAFFGLLIQSSIDEIAPKGKVELCYTSTEKLSATPNDIKGWRFKIDGKLYKETTADGKMIAEDNSVLDERPIEIGNILVFILLVYIAISMIDHIPQLAVELSSGVVQLNRLPGVFNEWFGSGGKDHDSAETRLLERRERQKEGSLQ